MKGPSRVARRRKAHAGRRALTRHELALSPSDLDTIANRISASSGTVSLEVVFLERQTHTTSLVAVLWHGTWLPVAWQRELRQVKTVLPPSVLAERGFRPPRPATPEEQADDFLAGRPIRTVVFEP